LLVSAALALAGCADLGPPGARGAKAGPEFREPTLTVESAARVIDIGRSDKREVEQRLGPAERLAFDSGYEVWVYRARETPRQGDGAELVILFDPEGKVSKLRSRTPAPQRAVTD
jgi:hypothetical protein